MDQLIELSNKITDIGYYLLPFSFTAYLLFRPLAHAWRLARYFKLAKSAWYAASGFSALTGDHRIEIIVMFIAFIESYDLIFQYLEDSRDKKST